MPPSSRKCTITGAPAGTGSGFGVDDLLAPGFLGDVDVLGLVAGAAGSGVLGSAIAGTGTASAAGFASIGATAPLFAGPGSASIEAAGVVTTGSSVGPPTTGSSDALAPPGLGAGRGSTASTCASSRVQR